MVPNRSSVFCFCNRTVWSPLVNQKSTSLVGVVSVEVVSPLLSLLPSLEQENSRLLKIKTVNVIPALITEIFLLENLKRQNRLLPTASLSTPDSVSDFYST